MVKQNERTLWILALIAMVNMLGYGIIIPLVYDYAKKFGLSDFDNGLLLSIYSLCQFISTPIIGRLSDKYGRRPMLLLSISGTVVSFFLMAFAQSSIVLFIARALDGLTAGNIPVIFAVIADSTKPEDRAKAFGRVSAAFNFGFIFGPVVGALTVGFGGGVPFIIAGLITLIAVAVTVLYLPETNAHIGQVHDEGKLFDLKKLWNTLFDPNVGVTFLISLVFFLAFSCLLYGFRPFTKNALGISETANALLFTMFGTVGLITQSFLVAPVTKRFGMKKTFKIATFFTSIAFLIMFASQSIIGFIFASILLSLFNSIVQTLIPTILSQETDEKSQGSVQGLNASYQSIGMIFGPILGGAVATISIPSTFLAGSILVLVCFFLSFKVLRPGMHRERTF